MPTATVKIPKPTRFQRTDRPYCPVCGELMCCYSRRGNMRYHKCEHCEDRGIVVRAKVVRRDVEQG